MPNWMRRYTEIINRMESVMAEQSTVMPEIGAYYRPTRRGYLPSGLALVTAIDHTSEWSIGFHHVNEPERTYWDTPGWFADNYEPTGQHEISAPLPSTDADEDNAREWIAQHPDEAVRIALDSLPELRGILDKDRDNARLKVSWVRKVVGAMPTDTPGIAHWVEQLNAAQAVAHILARFLD